MLILVFVETKAKHNNLKKDTLCHTSIKLSLSSVY